MTAIATNTILPLSMDALDLLMPMHAIIGTTGHIRRVGPTLAKLVAKGGFDGARFLEVFEFRRPRGVTSVADLVANADARLSLRLRAPEGPVLKGLAVALPRDEGILINLSFGIAAVDAVGRYKLSRSDFPATDLTVEMLYLVEANAAVMDLSRNLNKRLLGARIAAEEQAFTDTLTGLKNRRAMDHILDRYTSMGESFGLMQVDLDHFKSVNDTFGHAAGDHVLQIVARMLVDETREEDTVVRAGGDEFVLILRRLTDRCGLGSVADRLQARLAAASLFDDKLSRVSASIGITASDAYASPNPAQMLLDADKALYVSKETGRARHSFVRFLERDGGARRAGRRDGDGRVARNTRHAR